jgi:hypothetical protein
MKFVNLFLIAALGITFSYAKEKVDCNDPKNLPRLVAGMLIGGGKRSATLIAALRNELNASLI